MERIPVTSSAIASVGYDPITMTLEVEFLGGSIYQYFDIPEAEYLNFISAESLGRYLNQNIKSSYRYTPM